MAKKKAAPVIDSFDLEPGRILARKYEIVSKLGAGWEGEVYRIRERTTGIERAAKLFYPQRNLRSKSFKFYARQLHKLRQCPIVIQYHTEERILFRRTPITVLVSEFVEGVMLSEFLKDQPGQRLHHYQALHLLHALIEGIECIHLSREYHGDLHSDNVMVSRYGLRFKLQLLDFFHWAAPKRESLQDDVCAVIRLFYDSLGGQRFYSKQPQAIKDICLGLKRSLILKRFPTATHLRIHIETMQWSE